MAQMAPGEFLERADKKGRNRNVILFRISCLPLNSPSQRDRFRPFSCYIQGCPTTGACAAQDPLNIHGQHLVRMWHSAYASPCSWYVQLVGAREGLGCCVANQLYFLEAVQRQPTQSADSECYCNV